MDFPVESYSFLPGSRAILDLSYRSRLRNSNSTMSQQSRPTISMRGLKERSGSFQIRQSTSCPQANCILTSNNYFNGFFRFTYFLNVFKDE